MDYVKSSTHTVNGVETVEPDETVDAEHVERFTAPATLQWFRNLGGTETVTRRKGRITVRSVSPDGTETRITTFVPVEA